MFRTKILSVCIILIIITLPILGQANFVKGYIVNNKNDTLNGQIDYQEWVYTPNKIRFRTDNISDGKYYTAKDIKGFTIAYKDERYESAMVEINYEPTDFKSLPLYESIDSVDFNVKLTKDTVFLLTVAKGRLNLFEFQQYNHDQFHYFIQDGNNRPPQELIRYSVRIQKRDTFSVLTIEKYKNQLKNITADCYDASQNFIHLPYQRKELLNLVKKYNACAKASYYVKKQEKGDKYFSVKAGIIRPVTLVKELSELADYSPKESSSHKITPLIAISYEQNYNRLRNKLGIGGELNLGQVNVQHRKTITYSLGERYFDYSLKSFVANFNLYVRYYLTAGKIQPYLKTGLGLIYFSNTTLTRVKSEQLGGSQTTTLSIKNLHGQYLGGVGMKYNNFILEARFDGGVNSDETGADPFLIRRASLSGGYTWNLSKKRLKNR